jgi:hypothetical protein
MTTTMAGQIFIKAGREQLGAILAINTSSNLKVFGRWSRCIADFASLMNYFHVSNVCFRTRSGSANHGCLINVLHVD